MASTHVPYDGPIVTLADARASGLRRYFIGIPCPAGHIAERQVRDAYCVVCAAAAKRLWFDANPDYRAKWHIANKPKHNAKSRAWHAANPEKAKAIASRWYAKNKAYALEKSKRYAVINKDLIKGIADAWRKRNPDSLRATVRNRRARKRQIGGKHTAAEIKALYARQKAKCAYCRQPIKSGYHADHIMPLALGGSNSIRNIQLTCAPCNLRKNMKHPVDFARSVGLLI